MAKIPHWEKYGIRDFFTSADATDIAIVVAKIVSKNMLNPQTNRDAIEVILLHSTSTQSILNRKAITKEHLFKYLHTRKVPVTSEFTKQLLIEKTLQYWKQSFYLTDDEINNDEIKTINNRTNSQTENQNNTSTRPNEVGNVNPEQFPINQMARNFATWFYQNLNQNRLQAGDFFCDCQCKVEFLENQQCLMVEQHSGAQAVLEFCQSLQSRYNLFLNLNISHSGTQGRIDCHGLVLVLTCGTLHKVNQFVGTFEAVFGLSRDPFSQNNWKMNQIALRLHNFSTQQSQNLNQTTVEPTLVNSQSIIPLLRLSMPTGDVDIE